jgi:uncharacterized protein (DUF1684 family)
MKMLPAKTTVAIITFFLSACSADEPEIDLAAYEAEIQEWRVGRLERLKGPTGYLNLVGLFWLDEGGGRLGSAADNDILFPEAAAPHIGELEVTPEGVVLTVADDVDVRHGDEPVASILIKEDTTGNPVTVTHGSFAWTIIKRDERFALRLRDFEHPAIEAFPPIESYPIDPAMRVSGTLMPFAEPKVLDVDTTIEGLGYHPLSPGKIAFELYGETHELEAYASGDQLFFIFADQTTGRETYPAGRFLYADVPDENGRTFLDFNLAYNPPCAFNDFATCPVASPRNRLGVRVAAGEKFDPKIHATPGKL